MFEFTINLDRTLAIQQLQIYNNARSHFASQTMHIAFSPFFLHRVKKLSDLLQWVPILRILFQWRFICFCDGTTY